MGRKFLIALAGACFLLSWFTPDLRVSERTPYRAVFSSLQSLVLAPSCAGLAYLEAQLLTRILKLKEQVKVFGVSNF